MNDSYSLCNFHSLNSVQSMQKKYNVPHLPLTLLLPSSDIKLEVQVATCPSVTT